MNLQVIRGIITGIAYQAGDEIMRFYDQPHEIHTKSNDYDFATEADHAAEALIAAALLANFPDHHVVGEEGGGRGVPAEEAAYFWYVDPVDGTSNFASNIPFFSVSIALADREKRPLVGVVYNPISREVFSAARGEGATLNGRRLHVSATTTLGQSMLCSGFPYDRSADPPINLNRWKAFLPQVRGLRRYGSAALELCWVAAGRFDGFWEGPLNYWDYFAGMLMVEEAGGRVTSYEGGQPEANILASNGHLHDVMLRVIAEAG